MSDPTSDPAPPSEGDALATLLAGCDDYLLFSTTREGEIVVVRTSAPEGGGEGRLRLRGGGDELERIPDDTPASFGCWRVEAQRWITVAGRVRHEEGGVALVVEWAERSDGGAILPLGAP